MLLPKIIHKCEMWSQGFLFKQAMKSVLVGGIIYYTYREGLWSDAYRSACFLGKFLEKCPEEDEESNYNEFQDLNNMVIEDPEACQPFIPRAGFILYKIGLAWNQTVIYFFWFILDGPRDIWRALVNWLTPKPKPVEPVLCPL